MNTNTVAPYLETLIGLNNTLIGLPALVLVFIGCLGWAGLLFALPFVPNRYIPSVVIVSGIVSNWVFSPLGSWVGFGRATLFGLIVGVGSWLAFKKFASRWITADDFIQNGDTEIIKKPTPPPAVN